MLQSLKLILDIQELDIKMIRLVRLKRKRQKELDQVESLRAELRQQLSVKESEISGLNDQVNQYEEKITELTDKIKKLESQQSSIKKLDEFNALTQEITTAEREKTALEQRVSNMVDARNEEEEILEKVRTSLQTSEESSRQIEEEIRSSISKINEEGQSLKVKRATSASGADTTLLAIYERLIQNKKDRVVVPIENRTCSGCHIALTAQHENVVRKGENLTYCEHCSRIHYWRETEDLDSEATPTKRRRRRTVKI